MPAIGLADTVPMNDPRRLRIFVIALALLVLAVGARPPSAAAAIHNPTIGASIPFTVQPNTVVVGVASCPSGNALSGGIVQSGPAHDLTLRSSGPLDASGTVAATRDGDTPK